MRPDTIPKVVLTRLRKICLAWPGAAEVRKWGHPVFVVHEKIFATLGEHEGDPVIGFKALPEERDGLLEDPRFFPAAYVGRFGWLSMRADTQVDWKQVQELLLHSYQQIARKSRPKKHRRTR